MFGEKILQLLDEKEISQKTFASMLNIAPTTLNGYIKNKRQPDFETVKQIATLLNVSIDYLLDYNNEFKLTEKELSLIMKIRKLTPPQLDILYDLINITLEKNNIFPKG